MRIRTIPDALSLSVILLLMAATIGVQFLSPDSFYDNDSYYHAAVAGFIKDHGLRYDFRWAKFSTFASSFSDKDFLFHLLTVPFLYLVPEPMAAAKCAIAFYGLAFILLLLWLLRRYLPLPLAVCLLCAFLFTPSCFVYFIVLRPLTLANILMLTGIWCLIYKKWRWLAVISALFALTHLSFFLLIFFAIGAEIVRYAREKEFYGKNILAASGGALLGCLLHPNFPHNLGALYLNGILVPWYSFKYANLDLGQELFPLTTRQLLLDNLPFFIAANIMIWLCIFRRSKISLATTIWWGCLNCYLFLGLIGRRYWYPLNSLFVVFFASYLSDWQAEEDRLQRPAVQAAFAIGTLLVCVLMFPHLQRVYHVRASVEQRRGSHYRRVGEWMKTHIPAGATIYHSSWDESPLFIFYDPTHSYLVVLDPVYMYAYDPQLYRKYLALKQGKMSKPCEIVARDFGLRYLYTRKDVGLYQQLLREEGDFQVRYEDGMGILVELQGK